MNDRTNVLQSETFSFVSNEVPKSLLDEFKTRPHTSRSTVLELVQKILAQKGASLRTKYPFPRLRYETSFLAVWEPESEVHLFVRTKADNKFSQLIVMLINKRKEGEKPYRFCSNASMTFQLGREGYEEVNLHGLKTLTTEDMIYRVDEVTREQNVKVRGQYAEENKRRVALVLPRMMTVNAVDTISTIEIRIQQLIDRDQEK